MALSASPAVDGRHEALLVQEGGACDASDFGFGVVEATWDDEVCEVGPASERARFKGPLAQLMAPRTAALVEEAIELSDPAALLLGRDAKFQEVGLVRIQRHEWGKKIAGRWSRSEAIHGVEGSACSLWSRRSPRCTSNFGKRHLGLGDNMAVVCSLAKGRASDFPLLHSCRVTFAVALAADMLVTCRWIPSEANPADGPSRLRSHCGVRVAECPPAEPRGQHPHAAAPRQWRQPGCNARARAEAVAEARLGWQQRRLRSAPIGGGLWKGLGAGPFGARLAECAASDATVVLGRGSASGSLASISAPPALSAAALDLTLEEFASWLYDRQSAKSTAGRIVPALVWSQPRLHTAPLRRLMPRMARTCAGWAQCHPSTSRPLRGCGRNDGGPLRAQRPQAALLIGTLFFTYGRPSELLALTPVHVPSVASGPLATAFAHACHRPLVRRLWHLFPDNQRNA